MTVVSKRQTGMQLDVAASGLSVPVCSLAAPRAGAPFDIAPCVQPGRHPMVAPLPTPARSEPRISNLGTSEGPALTRHRPTAALAWLGGALMMAGTAQAAPTVLKDANTTAPLAPFYIDLSGMDMTTSPPTRDPANPHYPAATALPDGTLPPARAVGNFIIGAAHPPAAATVERAGIPKGRIVSFTMSSAEGVIYQPGLVREEDKLNAGVRSAPIAAGDPSNVLVSASRAGAWSRTVTVYIPAGNAPRKAAPLMVAGDGDIAFNARKQLIPTLDNLIADHKIPPIVVVLIGSGGQDAQGSERGREYDAVSGTYAAWVESEVLPLVEKNAGVTLTRDPSKRATLGISSSGAAAFTMAWFRPDLYRRVLAFSPTFVNQQWPHDPALPGGAWQYHSPFAGGSRPGLAAHGFGALTPSDPPAGAPLLASAPRKPIRFWFSVGDHDLFFPMPQMVDGMHDWVLANENMARALAAKHYQYQFVFARNGGHVDGAVTAQTLPAALEWVWAGYPAPIQ